MGKRAPTIPPSLTQKELPLHKNRETKSQNATLKLDPNIDLSVSPVSLIIFDVTGRIVNRMDEITSQETVISADGMVSGIYFYEVIRNGNILSTGKMMINK